MKCHQCGVEVEENSVYCHKCGARIDGQDAATGGEVAPQPSSSRRGAAALASKGDDDDFEEDLWSGSYSPRAMMGGWILAAVVTVGGLVLAAVMANQLAWFAIVAIITLLWLYLAVLVTYRRWSVRYRLSSQRFTHEVGILSRTTDRIEVIDMDDITYRQGFIERMLGIGTIRITSSDRSHPELILRGIENVSEVADMIDQARRKERIRRGLHIEAV